MEESAQIKLSQLQAELDSLHKAITVLNQLAAELDIHTAMQNVRQVALELLDCERVTLFLIFDRRGELRAMIDQSEILRIKFGEGIAGLVAQTGGSMNLPDVYEHPMFNKEVDRVTGFRTRNMLCMAISDMTGKNVAVLQALNKKSDQPFTPADERNLKLFGTHLGNTLVKAKLHETAKREKERLQAIYKCFKSLSTAEEVGQMVVLATAALERDIIHADRVFFFLVDAPRGELWLHTHQAEPVRLRVGTQGGVVGHCAEIKKPQSWADFEDAHRDPALSRLAPLLLPARIKNVLVQPIHGTNNDRVLAVVLAVNKREAEGTNDIFFEPFFTDADCDAMALFAYEVGDLLSERSLELSLLSALSVVGHDGAHPNATPVNTAAGGDADGSSGGGSGGLTLAGSMPGNEDLIRSQLIQMYLPEYKKECHGAHSVFNRSSFSVAANNTANQMRASFERKRSAHFSDEPTKRGLPKRRDVASATGRLGLSLAAATARSSVWAANRGQASRTVGGDENAPGAAVLPTDTPDGAGSPFTRSDAAAGEFLLPELGSLRCASSSQAEHPVALRADEPMAADEGLPCTRSGRSLTVGGVQGAAVLGVRSSRAAPARPATGPRDASLPPSPLPQLPSPVHAPHPQQPERQQQWGRAHSLPRHGAGEPGLPGAGGGGGNGRLMAPWRLPVPPLVDGGKGEGVVPSPLMVTASSSGTSDDLTDSRRARRAETSSDEEEAEEAAGPLPNGASGGGHGGGDGDGGGGESGPRGQSHTRARRRTQRSGDVADVEKDLRAAAAATLHAGVADPQALRTHLSCSNLNQAGSPRSPCFYTREQLYSWDWDFLEFNVEELIKLAYDIFIVSGAMEQFELKPKVLRNFLTAVASHYHAIPYHNFNHVCHVLHATFLISDTTRAREILKPVERLALLLAALCHDLDHDGHSNSFHVNSGSELARIYNDQSVMENHHCAMAFAILSRTDCNVLAPLPPDEQRAVRKAIIAAILCTDMANHFTLTQEFQKHSVAYEPDNESDRMLLLKVLLHAADIGNAVRPFHVNHVMSRRVHREFEAQAGEEVRLGLPVTFPVDTKDHVMCARIELHFLDYVVTTLWERLVDVLPELEPQMQKLRVNRARYRIIADTGKTSDQVLAEELQQQPSAPEAGVCGQLDAEQSAPERAAAAPAAPEPFAAVGVGSTDVGPSEPAAGPSADDIASIAAEAEAMLISPRSTFTHLPNGIVGADSHMSEGAGDASGANCSAEDLGT